MSMYVFGSAAVTSTSMGGMMSTSSPSLTGSALAGEERPNERSSRMRACPLLANATRIVRTTNGCSGITVIDSTVPCGIGPDGRP